MDFPEPRLHPSPFDVAVDMVKGKLKRDDSNRVDGGGKETEAEKGDDSKELPSLNLGEIDHA